MCGHDHAARCGRMNHIGAEIGLLNNLMRRQMACMAEAADNITGVQGRLLRYMVRNGKDGELLQRDIEDVFQMRRSTVTGILQLMEQHGLIRREAAEHDARLKRIVLTDLAYTVDERVTERIDRMEQMLRRGITEEELNNWFAVSEKIRSNLEQYQGNLCREGQKNGKTADEKRA